ncbi:MAG: NUDIX domain-containing protein [Chloroflexi bacterium]|nr:NUDIX domain-containing protein [Chloroflexota bacterium]
MTFLRLGTACAVLDDEGRVLLSQRGDLRVWNLPGGRVDAGELLAETAAREVREETGVIAHIERPVGLYYLAGWNRLNVVYAGWPLGGSLLEKTNESRANGYFDLRHLPDSVRWEWLLFDVISDERPLPRIIETPPDELRRVRRQFRLRWLKNLLSGRPEPRYPRFEVRVVGLVWDEGHRWVLTLPDTRGRTLPRVVCSGARAPWDELAAALSRYGNPIFHWVGLWQDAARDKLEFVFAATIEESDLPWPAEWSTARNAALTGQDAAYIERVRPAYARDPVWTIVQEAETIIESKEAV